MTASHETPRCICGHEAERHGILVGEGGRTGCRACLCRGYMPPVSLAPLSSESDRTEPVVVQQQEVLRRAREAERDTWGGSGEARTAPSPTTQNEAIASLRETVIFAPRDWALNKSDAWIYGIVCGWDDGEDGLEAMREVATEHGWSADDVARLKRLHAQFAEASRELASLSTRLEAAERERDEVKLALGDAAREIPWVAGPVAHRIRMLREQQAKELEKALASGSVLDVSAKAGGRDRGDALSPEGCGAGSPRTGRDAAVSGNRHATGSPIATAPHIALSDASDLLEIEGIINAAEVSMWTESNQPRRLPVRVGILSHLRDIAEQELRARRDEIAAVGKALERRDNESLLDALGRAQTSATVQALALQDELEAATSRNALLTNQLRSLQEAVTQLQAEKQALIEGRVWRAYAWLNDDGSVTFTPKCETPKRVERWVSADTRADTEQEYYRHATAQEALDALLPHRDNQLKHSLPSSPPEDRG